jgi:hypothetical protein
MGVSIQNPEMFLFEESDEASDANKADASKADATENIVEPFPSLFAPIACRRGSRMSTRERPPARLAIGS